MAYRYLESMQSKEAQIIDKLTRGDKAALKALFDLYYKDLVVRLYRMVPDLQLAEDIAQEVFIHLWDKRNVIQIKHSVYNYLLVASRNRLFNHLRTKRLKMTEITDESMPHYDTTENAQQDMEAIEMKQYIQNAIDALPVKTRTIFVMSRFENMNYKEIAGALGIKIKTVEYQMSKALKYLRKQLNR